MYTLIEFLSSIAVLKNAATLFCCEAAEIVSRNSSVIYESSPDSLFAWGCIRWWINIHFWVSVSFKKRTFSRFSFLLLLCLSQPFISLVFFVVLYFKRRLSLCLVFLFVRLYHRWTVRVCELYWIAFVTHDYTSRLTGCPCSGRDMVHSFMFFG